MRTALALLMMTTFAAAQTPPDSVYPDVLPALPQDPDYTPPGKLDFMLRFDVATDYVYRGLERFDTGRSEDRPNYQLSGKLKLDLDDFPSPFVAGFLNIAPGDPQASMNEARPTAGFDWQLGPVLLSAGHTNYFFPDRSGLDTAEVFARVELDSARLLDADYPLPTPFALAAYDYDLYEGTYIEGGVRQDFPINRTGLLVSVHGSVAYVTGFDGLYSIAGSANDSGFHHYEVGCEVSYDVNLLLNIPQRFGTWSLHGYIQYTDGIDDSLLADTQLWGGFGVSVRQ